MSATAEVRKLSLHPLAIHTFIKAQAGSLGKAISEAVMNSVDAFASTVEITLSTAGFTIADNGQGFRDRDEISAWFETLGFPHDDGNHRTYGKFGMGRAQMWAFARTTWYSNQFVMKVDVQKTGLDYELDEVRDRTAGTVIEATFYEQLSFSEHQRVLDEVKDLVRYVPGCILLNGKVINRDPSAEEWTHESPEAYMRFDDKAGSLVVYNGGVLVQHFPKYRYGCTGIIVTKPEHTLALNLARNDILVSQCKVWPKIAKFFPTEKSVVSKPKAVKPSKAVLDDLARQVKAGTTTLEKALSSQPSLVVSVYGRSVKYADLARGWNNRVYAFTPKGDDFGKRLSKLRLAEVIASESLTRFDVDAVGFRDLVLKSVDATMSGNARDKAWGERVKENILKSVWTEDPKAHFADLASGKTMYTQSELSESDKAVLAAWSRSRYVLGRQLFDVLTEDENRRMNQIRGVSLGDSPVDLCWIDSGSKDWVLRKKEAVDAFGRTLPYLSRYAMARVQDLCECLTTSSARAQELFIAICTQTDAVGTLLLNLSRFHINECNKRDLEVARTKLSELDSLGAE